MPNRRSELVLRLLDRISGEMRRYGYTLLQTEYGFIRNTEQFVYLVSVYDNRVKNDHILSMQAAIQAKEVEKLISTILERPMRKKDEATVGYPISTGTVSSWRLRGEQDIELVTTALIDAFRIAQARLEADSSLRAIAGRLAEQHPYPVEAQRILACAFLLKDKGMFDRVFSETKPRFEEAANKPTANKLFKSHYDDFMKVHNRLSELFADN